MSSSLWLPPSQPLPCHLLPPDPEPDPGRLPLLPPPRFHPPHYFLMGRGRPFPHAHARLVAAGIIPPPPWAAAVAAVPPSPPPLRSGVPPPALVFPEDRLRRLAAPHLRSAAASALPVGGGRGADVGAFGGVDVDGDAEVVDLLAADPARRSRLEAAVARVSALINERGLSEAAAVEAVVTDMAAGARRERPDGAEPVEGEWTWGEVEGGGKEGGAPGAPTVADEKAREDAEQAAVYFASLHDSQRDVELLHGLARAAAEAEEDDVRGLGGV